MSGVRFTRESAKRIADVVRTVELGDRDAAGLRFGSAVETQRRTFRIATFSGAWAINSMRTVEFKFQTNTPNTAVVDNLFFPFPGSTSTSQVYDCAIAREGTAWYLIDVPMQTDTAVFVTSTASQTVVSDVTIAAVLDTSNCAIAVSRTQTTASVSIASSTFTSTFIRFKVN